MLELYYAPGTCALASHIALIEASADYVAKRIDLKAGEHRSAAYLAINPKGKVPALVTEKGVLTENPVILGYIAQTHPGAKLADNDDSFNFGDMQAFNMYLATAIHPIFGRLFSPESFVKSAEAIDELTAQASISLKKAFQLVEDRLVDGREWVHGLQYTVSDPYLYVFSRWLDIKGAGGVAQFPNILAHRSRMQERKAVQQALADEDQAFC